MAKGDPVDAAENVLRLVGEEDFDAGRVSGAAFERIEKDHDGLSVTRKGLLIPNDEAQDLSKIRAILRSRRLPLTAESRLAEVNVGTIAAIGSRLETTLAVIAAPSKGKAKDGKLANPAHALVTGLPFKGMPNAEYATDLLRKAILKLHLAED